MEKPPLPDFALAWQPPEPGTVLPRPRFDPPPLPARRPAEDEHPKHWQEEDRDEP